MNGFWSMVPEVLKTNPPLSALLALIIVGTILVVVKLIRQDEPVWLRAGLVLLFVGCAIALTAVVVRSQQSQSVAAESPTKSNVAPAVSDGGRTAPAASPPPSPAKIPNDKRTGAKIKVTQLIIKANAADGEFSLELLAPARFVIPHKGALEVKPNSGALCMKSVTITESVVSFSKAGGGGMTELQLWVASDGPTLKGTLLNVPSTAPFEISYETLRDDGVTIEGPKKTHALGAFEIKLHD